MDLFIEDGYTPKVGLRGTKNRAPLIMTIRPFANADGARRFQKLLMADNGLELTLQDFLGSEADGLPRRLLEWNLKRPITEENLRKLRAPEFEALTLILYNQIEPDFEVGEDGKEQPFSLVDNAKNS